MLDSIKFQLTRFVFKSIHFFKFKFCRFV